ncbi:hypothetical protein [Nocardia cyriacigeorgica]|uniref:hypothetical protein n=1 Tax=Nocardia cyriacigeorgica TaxID=135487 RepID=UPI000CEA6309|nr:hypothetical protein [Nocardia cyriacigeorgica]PPJ02290.1 hypothetical protein C5E43_27010 [Nocardia cyriacigeorgica]
MINWEQIGQLDFDRVVESLIGRRYRNADRVTAVNGRGGDGGVDIEVVQGGRVRIFQLKYFVGGFSGGFAKSRREQIRKSFRKAMQSKPYEWTLVVPENLTPTELAFVNGLADASCTTQIRPPMGRKELDDLVIEFPQVDRWFQRQTLREDAIIFGQEKASMLAGVDDLDSRVRDLGVVTDSMMRDWTFDFHRVGDTVTRVLRPQNPLAAVNSPIAFRVEGQFREAHAVLKHRMRRSFDFGTSDQLDLPAEVVSSITIEGPEFIAGKLGPVRVILTPESNTPGVGKPVELRILDEDGIQAGSHEGIVTHADSGRVGASLEASFYDGKLTVQLLHPLTEGQLGHANVTHSIAGARPADVRQVLSLARQLRHGARIETYIEGNFLMAFGNDGVTPREPDNDSTMFEEFADDLDIVQRHCGTYFPLPDSVSNRERVDIRVARLLIEGAIVASPTVEVFVRTLTGHDSPEVRRDLTNPVAAVWPSQQYIVTLGNRTLSLGPVYVFHPAAIAHEEDAQQAIAALDAGQGEGRRVRFLPGLDPYFYVALANVPLEQREGQPETRWEVIDVEQPVSRHLPEPQDSSEDS